MADKDVGKHF